jgi:molybdate transport system regulatory protein
MTKLIVRIDLGNAGHIGPGKIMLLERIRDLGSISAAGRSMNMSYRQAWELIEALNTAFKEPLVVSHAGGKSGGGAVLTAAGEEIVQHYRAISEKAAKSAQQHVDRISQALKAG